MSSPAKTDRHWPDQHSQSGNVRQLPRTSPTDTPAPLPVAVLASRAAVVRAWVVATAAVLAIVAALPTIVLTWGQAKTADRAERSGEAVIATNNRLMRAQLDSGLQSGMIEIDRDLVRYPDLASYFLGNRELPSPTDRRRRAQVLGTANHLVDFADEVASYMREGMMDRRSRRKWVLMMRSYFHESPALRLQWKLISRLYDRMTACVLGAPATTDAWSWRENQPKAIVRRAC